MDLRDIRRPNRNILVCNSNAEAGRIAGFKDLVQEVKCTTSAVSVSPTTKAQFVPSSVKPRPSRGSQSMPPFCLCTAKKLKPSQKALTPVIKRMLETFEPGRDQNAVSPFVPKEKTDR
jgi:hypothetical protein